MNCFMGYNPLATKQVKVTVWVCEQDGASPVAPSNPSEGDCFIVYATDEAMLSNTPTSKKTYTNGDWADAEGGGGGGDSDFTTATVTVDVEYEGSPSDVVLSTFEDSGMFLAYLVYEGEGFKFGATSYAIDPDATTTAKFCYMANSPFPCNFIEVSNLGLETVVINSGNAEWNADDSQIVVSGDCSFTIKLQGIH